MNKTKNHPLKRWFFEKSGGDTYFLNRAWQSISSAPAIFTTLFGMGRGSAWLTIVTAGKFLQRWKFLKLKFTSNSLPRIAK